MISRLCFFVLLLVLSVSSCFGEGIRGVWFTTNWGLDWPQGVYDEAKQKEAIVKSLDRLKKAHFNLVFFQVQANGDVAWDSKYQPAMSAITGDGSRRLKYDVCRFVIDECHKRGMKCHAWVVPFMVGANKRIQAYDRNPVAHPAKKHKKWCVLFEKNYYLDPGLPEVRKYGVDVYKELLTRYDFDGLHLDYTRYPGLAFPDAKSFQKHNPRKLKKDEWRRSNINSFVAAVNKMAKSVRPGIVVGSAPIGTYRNTGKYKNATAYESYCQDPVAWVRSGDNELIVPQMYWGEDKGFSSHIDTWVKEAKGANVVVGLAPYRIAESGWKAGDVVKLMNTALKKRGVKGVCFFRAEHVLGNHREVKKLYNTLVNTPLR